MNEKSQHLSFTSDTRATQTTQSTQKPKNPLSRDDFKPPQHYILCLPLQH